MRNRLEAMKYFFTDKLHDSDYSENLSDFGVIQDIWNL